MEPYNMLQLHHVVALSIFSTYFITILTLFSLILSDIWSLRASKPTKSSPRRNKRTAVFIGLTIASLAHTWYYMLKYMTWSFENYELGLSNSSAHDLIHRYAYWLHETSLFKEAWAVVCFHPVNWWWSEQLCLFTAGTWTVFIAIEGRRRNIKYLWAYMLLGQIVAISVASNLFYLALILSQPSVSSRNLSIKKANSTLVISVLLSLATVALSPFTSPKTFLPNLLVMHALLFIPLISLPSSPEVSSTSRFSVDLKTLYRIIHLACVGIHVRTIIAAIGSLNASSSRQTSISLDILNEVWTVLHSHPAQSSIGWDIIWTSFSFIVWILLRPRSLVNDNSSDARTDKYGLLNYLILATPVASIAVTAPYALRPREDAAEGVRGGSTDDKEKKRRN
ncbi:hypothetical protein BYT27DRAFT_7237833 [Phlegmacium glaucopus]|nr:hypothetical protein BYT27DRAFT_7237833 [Phlegmacium glaucopus]